MTNDRKNWEEDFRMIGEGSVRFIATREEVKAFITTLLKDQKEEVRETIEALTIDAEDEHSPYWKLGAARMKKTILDSLQDPIT